MSDNEPFERVPRDGGDGGDPQAGTDTRHELAAAQQSDEARQDAGHTMVPRGGIFLQGITSMPPSAEDWAGELQRQLRQEQHRRQELEGEVRDLEKEVQRLRKQLKDERDEANHDIDRLRKRLKEKTSEIDRLNDVIRDLKSELKDVKEELKDAKHQHGREMASMSRLMEDMYRRVEILEQQNRQRAAMAAARHVVREILNRVATSALQRWKQEPEPLTDHVRTWRDVMRLMKDWKADDNKPVADKMWSIAQNVAQDQFGVASNYFARIVLFDQASGAHPVIEDGPLRGVNFDDLSASYRDLAGTISALRDTVFLLD